MEEKGLTGGMSGETGGKNDPELLSGAALAYIGDAVFELMVRKYMLQNGSHQPDRLHKHTVSVVNAAMQSDMIISLKDELTGHEQAIFRRGRNASTITSAKHQTIGDYRRATGLEALFGYLYLKGEQERLKAIFDKCMEFYQGGGADKAISTDNAANAVDR